MQVQERPWLIDKEGMGSWPESPCSIDFGFWNLDPAVNKLKSHAPLSCLAVPDPKHCLLRRDRATVLIDRTPSTSCNCREN